MHDYVELFQTVFFPFERETIINGVLYILMIMEMKNKYLVEIKLVLSGDKAFNENGYFNISNCLTFLFLP